MNDRVCEDAEEEGPFVVMGSTCLYGIFGLAGRSNWEACSGAGLYVGLFSAGGVALRRLRLFDVDLGFVLRGAIFPGGELGGLSWEQKVVYSMHIFFGFGCSVL